jgi:hypothetical protein
MGTKSQSKVTEKQIGLNNKTQPYVAYRRVISLEKKKKALA